MTKQDVIISHDIRQSLAEAIEAISFDRLFVLTDDNTLDLCWPLVKDISQMREAQMITIRPSDDNKTLEALSYVWQELQRGGASRHSLMVNLGGGMVTDLGGFAASTFKRGIAYINVPTTLLSMVDASVGGKTGINFGGLKNEIGVFNCSRSVILDAEFLRTLDRPNLLSGYAEMIKHGLISTDEHWAELLRFSFDDVDYARLTQMVGTSVAVKERIVEEDPEERGLRKALNLGHTAGHAIESLAMAEGRTVLHGYAVAWGLVAELYLSHVRKGFPIDKLRQTVSYIKDHYGAFEFNCNHYPRLHEYMTHDKKNQGGEVNFTLLADVGQICINEIATKDEIYQLLDILQDA